MAMKRFPLTSANSYSSKYRPGEKLYATLELNQVAFPKTGMVVSQTPLAEDFTLAAPCENGMWVVADKAAGVIAAPAAATDKPIGIVYTTEKEYDMYHYGLQTFGRKIAGDYPRVGLLGIGDTFTTNCLQYNESDFANDEALFTALKAIDTTPLYVVPGVAATTNVEKAVPQIVKTKPNSGIYAKVVKFYTVPNGEAGVKYQIISL
jgi:hypothetical protein